MALPLVSIIIAVKNGAPFLRTALDSVCATNYEPREIIVVDGHSEDESRTIARSIPDVTIVEQPGRGLADAWNIGIDAASGDLIGFLDSDDLWLPDKLHKQVRFMMRNPEIQYTIGHVKFFLEPGHNIPIGFKKNLLEGDHVGRVPGTLLARKPLFAQIGTFDPAFTIAADVDWFARAKDLLAPMAVLPETFLLKRVHSDNLSNNARLNTQELLTIFKRSVDRQRQAKQLARV